MMKLFRESLPNLVLIEDTFIGLDLTGSIGLVAINLAVTADDIISDSDRMVAV